MQDFDDLEIDRIMEQSRKVLEAAKSNTLIAQQRQKEQYDHKHASPDVFEVGSAVLNEDFR